MGNPSLIIDHCPNLVAGPFKFVMIRPEFAESAEHKPVLAAMILRSLAR
jgi:hypothetical protein